MWSCLPLYGVKKTLPSEKKQAPPVRVPNTVGTQQIVFLLLMPKTNEQTKSSHKICKREEVTRERAEKLTRCELEEEQEGNVSSNLRCPKKQEASFSLKWNLNRWLSRGLSPQNIYKMSSSVYICSIPLTLKA